MSHSADIVIVDDDPDILEILTTTLVRHGHVVRAFGTAEQALESMNDRAAELVIAALSLPGLSGLELVQEVKQRYGDVALLTITGHPDVRTTRDAFRAGVTDYLCKPLKPQRVVAAVREALEQHRQRLQRHRQLGALRSLAEKLAPAAGEVGAGEAHDPAPPVQDVNVDLRHRIVLRGSAEVPLTNTEFALVAVLFEHQPRLMDPRELFAAVRGHPAELWEAREFCRSHVKNIRRKLEPDPASPVHLQNVYGRGYRWGGASR